MDTDKAYAEQLASEYAKKDDTKIKQLKKLDRKAKDPALIFSFTFGSIGGLLFGVGLCLSMGVIGDSRILGIIIGVIGIALTAINPYLHNKILEKGKEKYGSDIIRLANEVLEEKSNEEK